MNGTPIVYSYQHIPVEAHVFHPIFHHFGITSNTTLTPCCLCYHMCASNSLTHSRTHTADTPHVLVHVSQAQTSLPHYVWMYVVRVCVCVRVTVLFSPQSPSLVTLYMAITHTPHNHLSHPSHTHALSLAQCPCSLISLTHCRCLGLGPDHLQLCPLPTEEMLFHELKFLDTYNIHIFHAPYTLYCTPEEVINTNQYTVIHQNSVLLL